MKIAIDARELSKPQSGGFRSYVKGLLYGLSEIDEVNEYLIYLDRPIEAGSFKLPQNSVLKIIPGNRIIADRFTLKKAINAENPDIVHFPCNYGISGINSPVIISLLDTISLVKSNDHMSLKSQMFTAYSARMTKNSVPKADAIITISNYSRQQILKFFNVDNRITVIHLAGSISKKTNQPIRDSIKSFNMPYFLALASVDPRKNTRAVIDAFTRASAYNADCFLVVAASHTDAAEMIRRKTQNISDAHKIIILTDVNDSELENLYSNSIAFIFASLDEGFGLPPLEAMACGCPIASSNLACMPEVLGDAAIYFDPLNTDDIAAKLDKLYVDPALRAILRERGYTQLMAYSWQKTAEKTLDIYENVFSRRM